MVWMLLVPSSGTEPPTKYSRVSPVAGSVLHTQPERAVQQRSESSTIMSETYFLSAPVPSKSLRQRPDAGLNITIPRLVATIRESVP